MLDFNIWVSGPLCRIREFTFIFLEQLSAEDSKQTVYSQKEAIHGKLKVLATIFYHSSDKATGLVAVGVL